MGLILIKHSELLIADREDYLAVCREARANNDKVAVCGDNAAGTVLPLADSQHLPSNLHPCLISFPLDETDLRSLMHDHGDGAAFMAMDGEWSYPEFDRVSVIENALLPFGLSKAPTSRTGTAGKRPVIGWVASAKLGEHLLRSARTVSDLELTAVVDQIRVLEISVRWLSAEVAFAGSQPIPEPGADPAIVSDAKVLALIPHYQCEAWLQQCLASLVDQTRPPDAIVVIDDASGQPPIEHCEEFPTVTLLRSPETVGPYRLVQSVIGKTSFDAYLFQDADDWSASDRLETLLAGAERFGADLIGCQQAQLIHECGHFHTMTFPLDVNWGLSERPAHGLAHPTSLVSRRFLMKTAGFSSGMRFGADTEFLHRAVLAGRVINTPYLSYFWRGRPTSLSNSPETGRSSPLRQKMWETLYRYYRSALRDRRQGRPLSLEPLCPSETIELTHLLGPRLLVS